MTGEESLKRIIEATVPTTFLRLWPCTVERQSDDGAVDLLPDDDEVRGTGLQGVPLLHGIPGIKVRVTPGSRVLLGFQEGDPQKPYASLWPDGSSVDEIIIGGTTGAPIARQGDTVDVPLPPAVFTGTVNGAPATGTITFTLSAVGTIAGGSTKAKAAS